MPCSAAASGRHRDRRGRLRDRFSLIDGLDELDDEITAAAFHAGVRMKRRGEVRQRQGMLADWVTMTTDGDEQRGRDVFTSAGGEIESVVGL